MPQQTLPSPSEALSLLASLRVGEEVGVLLDGRQITCKVQRALHHSEGFGALYSQQVTVGFGPGRWNRTISASAMAAGYVDLVVITP